MRIGLDIDNVISDFDKKILKEFYKEDKNKRNKGIVNPEGNGIKNMFDWSSEEIDEFFNKNMEEFAKVLDSRENAKYYMDKLLEEGHSLYLISHRAYPHYTNPYEVTEKWLKENDINYTKLILSETTNKSKECKMYNIDVMFDDVRANCRMLKENGIKCYLMATKYNLKDLEGLEVVKDWKELYEVVNHLNRKNVILDTDTYNECDDQFALAYMLKSQDIFNIEAITVAPYSHKNYGVSIKEGLEKSYDEILKICNWLDFDTTNKVFKGSEAYISNGYDEENDAVRKIIEIALKNDKTYIMAIGAITNVAMAIKKEPRIIDRIEVVWLGGHSLLQDNNREFNFRQDINAVKIVFDSKVKLTIVPCKNVASNLRTTIYELNYYLKEKSELCNYLIDRFYNDGYHGLQERRVIWDISVIAYMINKNWFIYKEISCPNINDDTSYELTDNRHIITMVNYINVNEVYSDLFRKLGE